MIPVQEINPKLSKSASKYANISGKSAKKTSRTIPSAPERILDAPDVIDDYYLQLLDWSIPFGSKESGMDKGLLAVALNREVYIWNAATGDITNLMELPEDDYITSLSWVGKDAGTALAIGTGGTNQIQLWDAAVGKKLRTFRDHESRVSSLAWNNCILSSGDRSGEIHHHDVRIAAQRVGVMNHHSQEICGLKWSPEGHGTRYLASGSNDNTVNVWPDLTGSMSVNPIYTFDQHKAAVKAIGWCPWKKGLLATGGGTADRTLKVWDTNTGRNLHSIDTKSQVCSVIWSAEHHELITGHGYCDNQLIIWKYPALSKVTELTGHTSRILGMSMSPDAETVVSLGADETLRFWECFKADKTRPKPDVKPGNELSITSMRMIR